MKFTINKSAFTEHLGNVSRAIPAKATIPILTSLKITANAEGLILIGSDAEISIESFIPLADESNNLKIEETGSIVVTARLFNDIVRKLPTSEVSFESNEQFVITVASGQSLFSINGTDGSSYPRLPEIDSDHQVKLPTLLFKELINQTIFSTSNQESRPILTGIHLNSKESFITGVATDSHRLSQREIPLAKDEPVINFEAMTIPKKTLIELERIVQDDQTLEMIISQKQVIFQVDNITIYSRLIEGNYPETDRLIPDSFNTIITLNADDFLQAIDRASVLSHQGKNNVVQLEIRDGSVDLSVPTSSLGSANETIPTQEISGEDLKISFNPDYMKDALKSFGGVDIKIGFQSNIRPMLLFPLEESEVAHNRLIQLLTPIRTH